MQAPLRYLAAGRVPFTAADAASCGVDRHTLDRMVRSGALHRVGRAAFVPTHVWHEATREDRHLLRCRAALRRHPATLLSHVSAVVAHRLPLYRVDLTAVHLARTSEGRSGRVGRRHPVQLHPPVAEAGTGMAGGMPVCTPAVAVLQLADWTGVEAGTVAAEAGLHRGLIGDGELSQVRELLRLGRGRAHADLVVDLAGPHSESPGETLTLLVLRALGVGPIQQQVPIALPGGGVARVDFLLPDHGVVIEFDGGVKYEGADGRAALVREKQREDGIRATGREVVRLTWPVLDRPAHVLRLVADAAARAQRR